MHDRSQKFRTPPSAFAIAALLVAVTTAPVLAQTANASMPAAPTGQATSTDRSFLTSMLQETRAQLALAQLARERTSDVTIVRAANGITSEWIGLRSRLAGLAVTESAPVRGALSAAQHAQLWQLAQTPASRFGQLFLRDVQRGNERALSAVRQEGATTKVMELGLFASSAQPVIHEYQAMLAADLSGRPAMAQLFSINAQWPARQ